MPMNSQWIKPEVPPSGTGCLECEQEGAWWFHLRRCAECGHVGCCDQSLGQHGTRHFQQTGHRVMQSFEPGEEWFWDFVREEVFAGPVLAAPTSHPTSQTTPGPAERVPADWQEELVRAGLA